MKNDNYSKNNHCECGELISNNATNCYSCANKRKNKLGIINVKGENNPNFKDGHCYYKHFCEDCGKEIDKMGRSKKCSECYHKNRKGKPINHKKDCKCCCCRAKRGEYKGANNFMFKGDKAKKRQKYFCVDCGKILSNYKAKRCPSCANKGEKHPNWQDGISEGGYSYKFNKKLKDKIRKRDKYVCQLCHIQSNTVHHIDYNKQNNKKNNLINLCRSCNAKVNFNRDYWFAYFTYIMENR
jgi:hypothetical protein